MTNASMHSSPATPSYGLYLAGTTHEYFAQLEKARAAAKHSLTQFLTANPSKALELTRLISQLSTGEDVFNRKNMRGHITCSMLVVSPDRRKLLLIHHNIFNAWLPPGGHFELGADDEESLYASARREVWEETGLQDVQEDPRMGSCPLDIHEIPVAPNPAKNEGDHFHLDFLFSAMAEPHAVTLQEAEVSAAKWVTFEEALALNLTRRAREVITQAHNMGLVQSSPLDELRSVTAQRDTLVSMVARLAARIRKLEKGTADEGNPHSLATVALSFLQDSKLLKPLRTNTPDEPPSGP